MRRRVPALAALLALGLALPGAEARADDVEAETPPAASPATSPDAAWAVPAEGACQPSDGLRGFPYGQDAPPVPFQPGDTIDAEKLEILVDFFPPGLWEQRDRFFYEGMRLEIGPCFRDYSPPAFFDEATEASRGKARLMENRGLEGHLAGLPFPPDTIDPAADDAGLRWAWNVASRYQAGGFRGKFRISDMLGRDARAEPFEGEIFKLQMAHRADRADDDYKAKNARSKYWVAGGEFFMPFDARNHAWRQFRDVDTLSDPGRTDDLHAYLPDYRRVRRISATHIEGLYMPSFSVGVVKPTTISGIGAGGGGFGAIAGGGGVGGAVGGGAADSINTKRSGFEGLEIRPLLYHWKVLGVQDVLAAINASAPSYPAQKDRQFGPWGLSFASDRWDLRRALVLHGIAAEEAGADDVSRMVLYVDLQTLMPLFYMSYDAKDEPIDVGVYVSRWSEDRDDYPEWPSEPDRPVRVLDPVGASFANLSDIGGWRRESWEMVSTPPEPQVVRRLLSVSSLTKGR